jgi:hypothetical protein
MIHGTLSVRERWMVMTETAPFRLSAPATKNQKPKTKRGKPEPSERRRSRDKNQLLEPILPWQKLIFITVDIVWDRYGSLCLRCGAPPHHITQTAGTNTNTNTNTHPSFVGSCFDGLWGGGNRRMCDSYVEKPTRKFIHEQSCRVTVHGAVCFLRGIGRSTVCIVGYHTYVQYCQ